MVERIKELFHGENLDLYGFLPLERCIIKKQYLLDKAEISSGFAAIFAIPYYTKACDGIRNISAYAVGRDYHLFIKKLFGRMLTRLSTDFPQTKFAMFADHSPIDERDAAVRAGLGVIGKNGLLITEKYSSYVFLSELIVEAPLPEGCSSERDLRFCEDCGLCGQACPWLCGECDECLSALTQKKGELSEDEQKMISKYGLWGCDICSEVCPHTKKAKATGEIYSPVEFFNKSTVPYLTYDTVAKMSEEEFSKRAYSWRGRDTILRNAEIEERNDDKKRAKKQ